MSHENVVKTSDFIADYNRRDFDAAVRFFDPEIEWVLPALQRSDSCRGPDEVIRFWEGLDETFEELRLDPQGSSSNAAPSADAYSSPPPFLLLGPVAVLAEPDLVEGEQQGTPEAGRDEGDRRDLGGEAAERRRPEAGNGEGGGSSIR